MIVASNDEIKFWYDHCEGQKKTNFSLVNYCHKNKLDSKLFSNWKQRFNPWHGKYKMAKEREIELAELYQATNPPRNYFCNKHGLPVHRLSIILAHLGYMERLKEIYDEDINESKQKLDVEVPEHENQPERQSMQFITRTEEMALPIPHAPMAEVIEEQNHIELTITKGVKVTLSPEFPAEKIIKIIELLKDL